MAHYTDVFAQTRNAHGAVPVSQAQPIAHGEACETRNMHAFRFVPLSPAEAAAAGGNAATADAFLSENAEASDAADAKHIPLLQLASCIQRVTQTLDDGSVITFNGVSSAEMTKFAQAAGPLIARAPFAKSAADAGAPLMADAAFTESKELWAFAVLAANLAVSIQEFVQGHVSFQALDTKLPYLVKREITNPETGNSFALFFVTVGVSAEYAEWLAAPAFLRRDVAEGRFDYSFLLRADDAEGATIELMTASFEHEITASDYRLLSAACAIPSSIDEVVYARLNMEAGSTAGEAKAAGTADVDETSTSGESFTGSDLLGSDAAILETDLPVLRTMVRALVAAHMRDVRVDPFAADADTGYLAFDSLLSWLWYDFSRSLDVARIRYCAHCGKAFALVGHRGPDKLFCSIECKNSARNSRTGTRRNDVRRQFREEGATVAQLAKRHFADDGEREAQRRVRECLSSWPTLKHDLDDDIAANGWGCALLKRCRAEGLDMDKLLSAKRKTELKKLTQAAK